MKQVIGITSGDPAGIGPEVIRVALASRDLPGDFEFEVVGEMSGHKPGSPTKESARAAVEALETAAKNLLSGRWQAVVTVCCTGRILSRPCNNPTLRQVSCSSKPLSE